jgi:hypothetical protein
MIFVVCLKSINVKTKTVGRVTIIGSSPKIFCIRLPKKLKIKKNEIRTIENMNRFIEDTTNEFNTPISTILTNIELLDPLYECEGKQEMKRIEIASKPLRC